MSDRATLTVAAGDLLTALRFKPRRGARKSNVVDLVFDARAKVLRVEEARYALFSNDLPATGRWAKGVQVDGDFLRKVASVHSCPTVLELVAQEKIVEVRVGKFSAQLARLDGTARGIARSSFPVDKRHKGPVRMRPQVRHPTPKGDTWMFIANVVFPTEAYESGDDD